MSYGFVRIVIDELKRGQYPEYTHYLTYLNDLHWLSQELTKKNRTLQEVIAGSICLDTMLKAGTSPSELHELFKLLRKLSPLGYPAEAFVNAALRLAKLEEEGGLSFSDLEKKASILSSEVSTLEQTRKILTQSNSSLRSEEQDARQKLDRTIKEGNEEVKQLEQMKANELSNNKLTHELLARHSQVQAKLASRGISFDDLEALGKVFDEFEKHGMHPSTIVGFIQKINGLSSQVDAWRREVASVEKNLSNNRESLQTVSDQIVKGRSELVGLRDLKVQLETELEQVKTDYDKYYLKVDLSETFLHLLDDPSKITDQQLTTIGEMLTAVVRTRKTGTRDAFINYERLRESLRLLVETVAGKTLVWKETQERELAALRDMNSKLQLGMLGKLHDRKRELRQKEAFLAEQERALGEATEDKVLEVAVAHVGKGVIFLGKCANCKTKGAIIRGSEPYFDQSYNCPCCHSELKSIDRRPRRQATFASGS